MRTFRRSSLLLFLALGGSVLAGQNSADFDYAENIRAEATPGGLLVEIDAPNDGAEPLRYLLVERSEPPIPPPSRTQIIPVPAKRIVSLSTTYLGPLAALDQLDRVVAVDNAVHATDPEFRRRLETGEVREVGTPANLDLESVLAAEPDLVLLTRVGSGRPDLENRLKRAGIPVLVTSAWRENTPLGRAEWIKLFGLLTDRSEKATEFFDTVADNYEKLKRSVETSEADRPKVLLSAPYGGVWYIPGGQSYSAAFVEDAGGTYLWAENSETGSFPLDFEAVFHKAMRAGYWVNPSNYRSLEAIASADERFEALPAFQSAKVFNRTGQIGDHGGNAFFESGAIRPDQVLADLIAILHPELMPGHEFVFYEKLR